MVLDMLLSGRPFQNMVKGSSRTRPASLISPKLNTTNTLIGMIHQPSSAARQRGKRKAKVRIRRWAMNP